MLDFTYLLKKLKRSKISLDVGIESLQSTNKLNMNQTNVTGRKKRLKLDNFNTNLFIKNKLFKTGSSDNIVPVKQIRKDQLKRFE